MPISRRQLFVGTTVAAASVLAEDESATAMPTAPSGGTALTRPPMEVIALSRMGYGGRDGDFARVRQMGLTAYVDEQLNPNLINDSACDTRIANATLRIAYSASTNPPYPAVDEIRPLSLLNKPLAELWYLYLNRNTMAYAERARVVEEVMMATWIRAVYSKRQLLEVMTDFWHNHFSAFSQKSTETMVAWAEYDRNVIRKNCFGNFRTFLEDVAKSVSMLYYLDNGVSRDGPANENYARELFELHTMGAPNYLNALYDDWQAVPLDGQGRPIGYIDQDVYEAARAFTGWAANLTTDGSFLYRDSWHDNAQKIVLHEFFAANKPPMWDGERVLDKLADHPATARYVCGKLCRWLVSDTPPQSLIDKAVATWTANITAPDQIKKVIRTILLAPEFLTAWGNKVRTSKEIIATALRATNAEFMPTMSLYYVIRRAGYRMFTWPTPKGHPTDKDYWSNSMHLLTTWNMWQNCLNKPPTGQTYNYLGVNIDLMPQMPTGATVRQIVDFWINRLLGYQPAPFVKQHLLTFMAQTGSVDAPPVGSAYTVEIRVRSLVLLITRLPEFYTR